LNNNIELNTKTAHVTKFSEQLNNHKGDIQSYVEKK